MAKSFFDDAEFQDHLVALLCRDLKALRECAPLLHPDDFKPLKGQRDARARWLTAERALEFYQKHHEPIGRLLNADLLEYAEDLTLGDRQVHELEVYAKRIQSLKLIGPDAIAKKVIRYKRDKLRARIIQELSELQGSGQLSDDKFRELTQQLDAVQDGERPTSDYFKDLERRLERREFGHRRTHYPQIFIGPLDDKIRIVGMGGLATLLAPPKRGKSLALAWFAAAYSLQRLNVGLVTLEDPLGEVEDRLDSIVTRVPLQDLHERPGAVRVRFQRYARLIRTGVRILDGTQNGLSVAQIEATILDWRDKGFKLDVLIIDYDDEIVPNVKRDERRMEFADIYRDLRKLAARHGIIVWTAAQTNRGTESMKILAGDRVAEDYSKIRKVSLALSLGQGEWGPESIYIWVAAHRFDKEHLGVNIMTDKSRAVIYDADATHAKELEEKERANEEQ